MVKRKVSHNYQRPPAKVPEKWDADERKYAQQIQEALDDLYQKLGRFMYTTKKEGQ